MIEWIGENLLWRAMLYAGVAGLFIHQVTG